MDRVQVTALANVSGVIAKAETTFVTGPSGSGKSTLLNIIGMLDQPSSGTLTILDQDVSRLSDRDAADFRARHIGFVFQSFNLIPVLSLRENVEFPLLNRKIASRARRAKAMEYLDAVGLAEFVDRRPGEISGGQRQRVAIARALVTEPTMVIADEPTANLDTKTSRDIIALLDRMKSELSTSIVICTHDTSLITPASAVINIVDGQTAQE
ncbi:ABC transporter ATP-binding protein [Fertoebacter nigrum]|uniref:ABC transporter ATP-binding protein n=1 Tax=Fertoeibacter niger TaxID=2656921 RepID=A0A8X8H341_9RHOB|nr:ABC transporter ATP-binding protein [Fertoeibacter niger]NUB45434.1 ABC transporter ATP-binding protein [Fertoeibacter niger]